MLRHPALLLLACLCLPAGAAAALRHGIESPGRFWTLRQLRLTRADGSTVDYFLDGETCLPTREVSRRAFHPDVDSTEAPVETAFSEPERVGEVLRLRRGQSRRLDTGEWLGPTVVRSAEQNVKLAEDFFEAR
jgi:hypothetical protein